MYSFYNKKKSCETMHNKLITNNNYIQLNINT